MKLKRIPASVIGAAVQLLDEATYDELTPERLIEALKRYDPKKPDPYLTCVEVAQRLSLHPSTVRRLILDGDIPAVKIQTTYRVDPIDLDEYIERRRTLRPQPQSA